MRRQLGSVVAAASVLLAPEVAAAVPADHAHTDVIDRDIGYQGEAPGSNISADGRFVVFVEDRPGSRHLLVEDRAIGAVTEIPAPGGAAEATITPDGRFVAFSAGPVEAPSGVFVHDRRTGATEAVSVDGAGTTVGASAPSISDDGRFVAFSTEVSIDPTDDNDRDADGGAFATDVYVRVRQAGTTIFVSAAAGGGAGAHDAFNPIVSGDGRFVVFASRSPDLVPGDANGAVVDTFRWSVERRAAERIGLTAAGGQAPSDVVPTGLSRDGNRVALTTVAPLVGADRDGRSDGYLRDVAQGTTSWIDVPGELSYGVVLSADGRTAAWEQTGADGERDVHVEDLATGRREQVDVGPRGSDLRDATRPRVSVDGRFVTFGFQVDVPPTSIRDSGLRGRMAVRERFGSRHVGMAADADGGYWLVTESGDVYALGGASWHGSTSGMRMSRRIVGAAPTSSGGGYWLAADDGAVYTFGDARFAGAVGFALRAPVVGIVPTPSGAGYWLVAADGGVFTFGDAPFRGSAASLPLRAPVVGMAATPSGRGYWLVAADGGVFSFGDARFHGSTGALRLAAPVVGMAATPSGGGYWLGAADGGVFTFGDAPFRGSAAPTRTAVTAIASSGADGHWLVDADGLVRPFGTAPDHGSR